MREATFKYGNVTVKIVDHLSEEERKKKLEVACQNYFQAIESTKRKKVASVDNFVPSSTRSA